MRKQAVSFHRRREHKFGLISLLIRTIICNYTESNFYGKYLQRKEI